MADGDDRAAGPCRALDLARGHIDRISMAIGELQRGGTTQHDVDALQRDVDALHAVW
jgi:hypothetical protein